MTKADAIDASLLPDLAGGTGALSQRIYGALARAILSFAFRPGAMIRKTPICERLGVSRAPVADAIARLAADGLVEVVPQSGTFVSHLSLADIAEGAFLREALELATVAHVARHLTGDQRKRLVRNIRMQTLLCEDRDFSGFHQADEEFHGLLMNFTGFERVADAARTFSLQVSRARVLLLPTPGRVAETVEEHRAIFDAICDGDARAAQDAMQRHLRQLMPRIEALHGERPDLFGPAFKHRARNAG